ncbi:MULTISPECIES: polyprenyl synthetase family protein [unclassified Streptomyces]|uniref:polyprenyl synthetase family protein n=1 Tax=unclassified Streptomyces TaxID=2593676 RepID=UPI001BE9A39B|nr:MULTISPECIES: polyprenyl synthetase family protein [unclassified Streptomyces]MBT2403572.1 polyprenyl synthetase family protein [Streptomyces sp. ISL-21]MBT2609951.1 polyprenyl synthetase family protein [Streptomyces sp. ISL-87]
MSYVDLHRQVSTDIDAEIEAALGLLGPESEAVRNAVTKLLRHQKLKHPLSVLPMLVHAVETGSATPAAPLSALHVLWWTSACFLDDLADGHGTTLTSGLSENEAMLASVISGTILPFRIIQSLRVPAPVHTALTAEVATGWVVGTEGQLSDISGDVENATRKSVVTAYRGKSGGPFSMITAMAAILSGATREETELWREFGYVFGILWQLFNDQEDILSGRNEDLLNGTVTYLLTCALDDASPESREHLLALCAAARHSGAARSELTGLLLAPGVLHQYREDLDGFRDEAYRILDGLDGDGRYAGILRRLVDHAAQMLLEPAFDTARPVPV